MFGGLSKLTCKLNSPNIILLQCHFLLFFSLVKNHEIIGIINFILFCWHSFYRKCPIYVLLYFKISGDFFTILTFLCCIFHCNVVWSTNTFLSVSFTVSLLPLQDIFPHMPVQLRQMSFIHTLKKRKKK